MTDWDWFFLIAVGLMVCIHIDSLEARIRDLESKVRR
jgi:hypothetical protein